MIFPQPTMEIVQKSYVHYVPHFRSFDPSISDSYSKVKINNDSTTWNMFVIIGGNLKIYNLFTLSQNRRKDVHTRYLMSTSKYMKVYKILGKLQRTTREMEPRNKPRTNSKFQEKQTQAFHSIIFKLVNTIWASIQFQPIKLNKHKSIRNE